MFNVHELFLMLLISVTASTIYRFNPKFRLFFVRNWVLLVVNEKFKIKFKFKFIAFEYV